MRERTAKAVRPCKKRTAAFRNRPLHSNFSSFSSIKNCPYRYTHSSLTLTLCLVPIWTIFIFIQMPASCRPPCRFHRQVDPRKKMLACCRPPCRFHRQVGPRKKMLASCIFLLVPVVIYALDVVVLIEHVEDAVHFFDIVLTGKFNIVLWYHSYFC